MNNRDEKIANRTYELVQAGQVVVNDEGLNGYEVVTKVNGINVTFRLYDMDEVMRLMRVLARTARG